MSEGESRILVNRRNKEPIDINSFLKNHDDNKPLKKNKNKKSKRKNKTRSIKKVKSNSNKKFNKQNNLVLKRKKKIKEILYILSNFSNHQLNLILSSKNKNLNLEDSDFIPSFFSLFDSLDELNSEINKVKDKKINSLDLKSERKKLKKLDLDELCSLMDVNPDLVFSKGSLINERINQLDEEYNKKNTIFNKNDIPNLIASIYDIFYNKRNNIKNSKSGNFNLENPEDIFSKMDDEFSTYLKDKNIFNFLDENISYAPNFATIKLKDSYLNLLNRKKVKLNDGRTIIKRVLFEYIEFNNISCEKLKNHYVNKFSIYNFDTNFNKKNPVVANEIKNIQKINYSRESNIIKSFLEYKKIILSVKENHPIGKYENPAKNSNKTAPIKKSNSDLVKFIDDSFDLGDLGELNTFIDENKNRITELNNLILNVCDEYISKNKRNFLKKRYRKIYATLSKFNLNLNNNIKNNLYCDLKDLKSFINIYEDLLNYKGLQDNNRNLIKKANERYIENEINNNSNFFNKLKIDDLSKKRAIVIDEDNIKVIAGAGTGKTFTLQSKVKYLVEKRGVSPEKILCLCYTSKGANTLDERVNKQLDESNQVEVCTFHEFCRRVDRYCGNIKTTNRYLLDDIIRHYMKDVLNDSKKIDKLMDYFSYYMMPPTDKEKFDSLKELEEYERGKNLDTLKSKYNKRNGELKQTLKGEVVKSIEELIIANYLFMHEIDYIYEKEFGDNSFADFIENQFSYSGHFLCLKEIRSICSETTLSNERLLKKFIYWLRGIWKYRPDFYLTEYDIYLEHFGVDKDMKVHWLKGNEKIKYEKEMETKRLAHEMYGTKLIETYSFYNKEGCLLECLESLLKGKVTIGQRDKKEMLEILLTIDKINDYKKFMQLINSFINIFEAKDYGKNKFKEFRLKNKKEKNGYNKKRQELFLDIVEDIYEEYYNHNQSDDIDHNREISNALELIEKKEYKRKYDYILIDEYQDINFIRCKLLQKLQENSGAKIFAVGDDWQSIFKFNGSDVQLFIDFDRYFSEPETIKIEKSRRNPSIINEISSKFILKNPNQEKKKIKYFKEVEKVNKKPIKIVTYPNQKNERNKIFKLEAILDEIINNSKKTEPKILLLGRGNDDITGFVNNNLFLIKDKGKYKKVIYTENRNLDITFMTVHQSKGLEFDEVIVINNENKINGFPNQIEDDPLIDFVKTKESYVFAEERRLFYVALTRSRNNVYLLTPKLGYSAFINELRKKHDIKNTKLRNIRKNDYDIFENKNDFQRIEEHISTQTCPNCGLGKIKVIFNNQRRTKFVRCTECGYNGGPLPPSFQLKDIKYIQPCPSCRGILIRKGNHLGCNFNYKTGCKETKPLQLDEEDLDDEL